MDALRFDNGDRMPVLGLGTWKSEPGEVYGAVKEAIRLGYRHIDCSPVYGNEVEIGHALSECIEEGSVTRDDMWITSKLWNDCHAMEDVRPALESTLADLQLDHLDLYLIHWPVAHAPGITFPRSGADLIGLDDLPISETWQGMEAAAEKGLSRHIGVSNFSVPKLESLLEGSLTKPEVNQVELHPYLQQPSLQDFCRETGVFLTAYSPLGSRDRPGMLKEEGEPVLLEDPRIKAIADRHEATPAQVLISWAIAQGLSVIPKSVNPARLQENLAAAQVSLEEREMNEIANMDLGRRYISGDFFAMEGSPYSTASLWDE